MSITKDLIAQLDEIYQKGEKPVHCLLVEDDENDGNLTMRALKRVGVRTHWARSGDEAFNLLNASKDSLHPDYDVIFLDLVLKGSTIQGRQIFDRVRKDFPLIHIILLTGIATHEVLDLINSAKGQGSYVGLIAKPLGREEAQEVLSKHHLPVAEVSNNHQERNHI